MSAEEGSAQPPTAGSEKAQAPKAAATFSSFINKNTTGKKFAPKAARRRPGAAPPSTASPKVTASESAAPSVEQSPQPETESSNAAEEPISAVQLPTPAATQEPPAQDASQPAPAPTEATTAPAVDTALQEPAPAVTEPLPTTALPTIVVDTETEQSCATPTAQPAHPPPDTQYEADTGSARKRRRMDPPAPKRTAVAQTDTRSQVTDTSTTARPEVVSQPQQDVVTSGTEQAVAVIDNTEPTEAGAEQQVLLEPEAPRLRKRRTLPWNAVNRPREVVEEEVEPAPTTRTRKPAKPRGKEKATIQQHTQEPEQQEGAEDGEAPPVQKRPSAKARGKRRADVPNVDGGEEAPAPTKRARRSRKVKSKATVTDADADEEGGEPQAEEDEAVVVRRKPRQPRKKNTTAPQGETEHGEDGAQPKRKGRPPRESTPSDAEDNEIDPEVTFMDHLASRNIRVGQLSNREKAMREIDWDAVRQRRREEDSRHITTKEIREKADELLASQQPQTEMPQIRVGADGMIEMIHQSTTIDRYADADRVTDAYEIQEERDLTSRITSRSFLKNNKRFPNDFILPGQGKKWTLDDTELFYQGLRNFGTDFQMISHMFPNFTRRSIKLKFTREERENPDLVREALLGQSQLVSHWDDFIQVSQMNEERLADADEIKREMAEEEARMRVQIDAAKAEAKERRDQMIEAGVLDKDGNKIGVEKENVEKGKKKRKGKEKQVTFQDEPGVEIVGVVDEVSTWGQE